MPSVEDLRTELAVAKAHGRGTDVGRLKKELAALGATDEPEKPKAAAEAKPKAAESRAAAAKDDEGAKTRAPSGRTSGQGRQSKT